MKVTGNLTIRAVEGLSVLVTISAVVIGYMIYWKGYSEHRARSKIYIQQIKCLESDKYQKIDANVSFALEDMCKRNLIYILAYYRYQVIGKTIELLSVFYSVAAFALSQLVSKATCGATASNIISITSIMFVIFSIYVSPVKRAKEYIIAWRKLDCCLHHILQSYNSTSAMLNACPFGISNAPCGADCTCIGTDNIHKILYHIESELKTDEE